MNAAHAQRTEAPSLPMCPRCHEAPVHDGAEFCAACEWDRFLLGQDDDLESEDGAPTEAVAA